MTLEDWAALDDDVPGELVGGALEDEEDATWLHAALVTEIGASFVGWLRGRGLVAGPRWKLGLGHGHGRKPDVTVWLEGSRRPHARDRISLVPPDVAVEIVAPTPRDARRDRLTKHDEYAAFGIRWYWLLDPRLRTLEVFELRDRVYARVLGALEGAAIPVPGIPGATLDLDAIWRRVDELLAEEPEE